MHTNVVDAAYREHGIEFPGASGELAQWVDRLAELPLICQPGSQWNYSVATDVLGRLVEVWSGQSLGDFFAEAIFEPLGMVDTGFHVAPHNHQNFASLYAPERGGDMSNVASTSVGDAEAEDRGGLRLMESAVDSRYLQPASLHSGGGGLVGSMGAVERRRARWGTTVKPNHSALYAAEPTARKSRHGRYGATRVERNQL
jgi:CubicO group peptidase (beta-lactamase class C family)